jgi:hypothetical protein
VIGISAGEDAANAVGAEQFKGGVHAIAVTSEPDIDDGQVRRLRAGDFKRFFARHHNPDNLKTGVGQSGLYLACDQEIVLNDQDAIRPAGVRLRCGPILGSPDQICPVRKS